jgi:tetratricopeptide (TPR) repeat protein
MKANQYRPALEEVDRAIALNPRLPEAHSLRGRLLFIASDLPGVEASFREALKLDPNHFEALLLLGTLLREQGRIEEARALLDRAYRLRPKEIRVRYQCAVLASAEGHDGRAVEMLEDLIKDTPNYIEAHRSLSATYFRMGRSAEGRRERAMAEKLDSLAQAQDQALGRTLK